MNENSVNPKEVYFILFLVVFF